jgi:hypothetical protein
MEQRHARVPKRNPGPASDSIGALALSAQIRSTVPDCGTASIAREDGRERPYVARYLHPGYGSEPVARMEQRHARVPKRNPGPASDSIGALALSAQIRSAVPDCGTTGIAREDGRERPYVARYLHPGYEHAIAALRSATPWVAGSSSQ